MLAISSIKFKYVFLFNGQPKIKFYFTVYEKLWKLFSAIFFGQYYKFFVWLLFVNILIFLHVIHEENSQCFVLLVFSYFSTLDKFNFLLRSMTTEKCALCWFPAGKMHKAPFKMTHPLNPKVLSSVNGIVLFNKSSYQQLGCNAQTGRQRSSWHFSSTNSWAYGLTRSCCQTQFWSPVKT